MQWRCICPKSFWELVDCLLILHHFQVVLLLLLTLSNAIDLGGEEDEKPCDYNLTLEPRPHSVSILEFGAVGDGRTLNTLAFQNAIFYLKSFADKGGAQLYVPPGRWLTGSFNLTSHLTLFLEKGAVILGSQVLLYSHSEAIKYFWCYKISWRCFLFVFFSFIKMFLRLLV